MIRSLLSFDKSGSITIAGPSVIDSGQIIMMLIAQPDGSAAAVTMNRSDVQALINTLKAILP